MQSNTNVTSYFEDIPSERTYAVGGLIGTTPILCGGRYPDGGFVYRDSCLTLKDSKWNQTHKMNTGGGRVKIHINATGVFSKIEKF